MLESIFRDFGLAEREVKLYLELLELGPQPASVLARRFGLPRSTAQFSAEKLATTGFVTKLDQKGVTTYSARDANSLRHFIETNKNNELEKYRRWEKQLIEATPTLNKLSGVTSGRPKVSYYQGIKEVKQLFEDVIYEGKQVDFLSAMQSTCPEILHYLETEYVPRRRAQITEKTKSRNVAVEGTANKQYYLKNYGKEKLMFRTIPKKLFTSDINVQIYGNKVAYYAAVDAESAHGVLIQSDLISSMMRNMFDVLWSVAKK